eukprot:1173974-Heterocapsa_arctica.AAC.1
MFDTPSSSGYRSQDGGSEYSFRSTGNSPIVDTAREDNANRLQDSHRELDFAEREIAKQKTIANAEKAKHMFAEISTRATSRAWTSVASSSGFQESPE